MIVFAILSFVVIVYICWYENRACQPKYKVGDEVCIDEDEFSNPERYAVITGVGKELYQYKFGGSGNSYTASIRTFNRVYRLRDKV